MGFQVEFESENDFTQSNVSGFIVPGGKVVIPYPAQNALWHYIVVSGFQLWSFSPWPLPRHVPAGVIYCS